MIHTSNLRIAILGFGREGRAVLKFIKKSTQYSGAEIWILDQNTKLKLPRGVEANLGPDYLKNLGDFDLVFRSPGVPFELPELAHAREAGVKFSSATKLFFEHARGTIIGITGTKGKGTTCTLLYKILEAAGRDVHLAGNIGTPSIELLPKLKDDSITVLELSSFQLHDLEASPHIAAILDIFPDHLDSHANFEEYVGAKSSIAKFQKSDDLIFYAGGNAHAGAIAAQSAGKKIAVSTTGFALFRVEDLKMPGPHNFKNAVMAAAIARELLVPNATILRVVKSFKGLPHRLELVRSVCAKNRCVNFFDDSASTNPSTAAAAALAFRDPLILIAGGKDKLVDWAPFADAVAKISQLKMLILIGENKKKILQKLAANQELKIAECDSLKNAVASAYREAKELAKLPMYKNINIVLSPGSASFDMFRDYADRGEKFKKIVKGLK